MKIELGTKGLENSWQKDFPEKAKCGCGGTGRLAFVAIEQKESDCICHLYKNGENGEFWPHDAIAMAVYFCGNCREAITLWNQA